MINYLVPVAVAALFHYWMLTDAAKSEVWAFADAAISQFLALGDAGLVQFVKMGMVQFVELGMAYHETITIGITLLLPYAHPLYAHYYIADARAPVLSWWQWVPSMPVFYALAFFALDRKPLLLHTLTVADVVVLSVRSLLASYWFPIVRCVVDFALWLWRLPRFVRGRDSFTRSMAQLNAVFLLSGLQIMDLSFNFVYILMSLLAHMHRNVSIRFTNLWQRVLSAVTYLAAATFVVMRYFRDVVSVAVSNNYQDLKDRATAAYATALRSVLAVCALSRWSFSHLTTLVATAAQRIQASLPDHRTILAVIDSPIFLLALNAAAFWVFVAAAAEQQPSVLGACATLLVGAFAVRQAARRTVLRACMLAVAAAAIAIKVCGLVPHLSIAVRAYYMMSWAGVAALCLVQVAAPFARAALAWVGAVLAGWYLAARSRVVV